MALKTKTDRVKRNKPLGEDAIPPSSTKGNAFAARAILQKKASRKDDKRKKRERRDVTELLQQSNLIKHEQLIDAKHLSLLEQYVRREFPAARFNQEGSKYYTLASSYRVDADTGIKLACLIISNGDKFYLDIATENNAEPEFYESASNSIE